MKNNEEKTILKELRLFARKEAFREIEEKFTKKKDMESIIKLKKIQSRGQIL